MDYLNVLGFDLLSCSCDKLNMERLRPHNDMRMAVLNISPPSDRLAMAGDGASCVTLSSPSPWREKLRASIVLVLLILNLYILLQQLIR